MIFVIRGQRGWGFGKGHPLNLDHPRSARGLGQRGGRGGGLAGGELLDVVPV